MASAALWPSSAEELFLFCVCRGLRAAPSTFSQIRTNQQKMQFLVTAPSVKKQFWKIRRFSRTANIKSFSAENIRVAARGGYV